MAAPTAAPLEEGKAKKVIRQVEFYFSDSNLPRDKFLRETVEQSDDGLVSLPLICSFSRMKSHLGLDADVKAETMPEETVLAVAEVLRRSPVLRISEDGKKIGRASELSKPDEIIEQVDSRTIAVSPLPYNVKLEDIQSFFTNYAKVNSVRLPRNIVNEKHFCGTALVEFSEEEEAKSIMDKALVFAGANLEIRPNVRLPRNIVNKKHFCGTALVEFSEEEEAKSIMDKALVFAGANLEIRPKKEFDAEQESKKEAYEKARPRRDNQNEGYPKGLIVAFKLKKTMVDSVVQQDNIDEGNDKATKLEVSSSMEKLSGQGPESTLESDGTKQGKSSDDMTKEKELNTAEAAESEKCIGDAPVESDKHGDSGSLSRDGKNISGNVNVKNQISREDLKEAFKKFGTVRYVDFSIGDNSGYLRFEDSKAAEKARMSAVLSDEGSLIIKDHIVTLEPVTGEAEKDYWNTIRGIQGKYKDSRSYKGRALKNQRGGKHFNRKRDRNPESEKNSNKTKKVEAAA